MKKRVVGICVLSFFITCIIAIIMKHMNQLYFENSSIVYFLFGFVIFFFVLVSLLLALTIVHKDNRKNIWKRFCIIGCIPFIIILICGVYFSITGFSLCFCTTYDYGWKAFIGSIGHFSVFFYPNYIIGMLLLLLSFLKLVKVK